MVLTLAQIPGWLISLLAVFFLVVCLALILIVLIQRPQGGGLSGAFGAGAGSGQTAFGTKTGDVLTLVTIAIFVLFLGTAIGLNFAVRPPAAGPRTERVVEPGAGEAERARQAELEEMGGEAADVDGSLEGDVSPAELRGEQPFEEDEPGQTPPPSEPPAQEPPAQDPAAPPPGDAP